MPIYEYLCASCEATSEALQGLNDPVLVECKACHQPTLQRLVSSAGFRLKGSGWYETDFKKDKQKNLVTKEEGVVAEKPKVAESSSTSTQATS